METKPLSGREAVEYFAKCYHQGKIGCMYFNFASSRHYKPYHLIQVKKNKVTFPLNGNSFCDKKR